jgi:hypothetical protein
MKMYKHTTYMLYVQYVKCNSMLFTTCLMQLRQKLVACVKCNWKLVANDNCKKQYLLINMYNFVQHYNIGMQMK